MTIRFQSDRENASRSSLCNYDTDLKATSSKNSDHMKYEMPTGSEKAVTEFASPQALNFSQKNVTSNTIAKSTLSLA
jgi:hypothetical protein